MAPRTPAITDELGRRIELYTLVGDEPRLSDGGQIPEGRRERLELRLKELIPAQRFVGRVAEVVIAMLVIIGGSIVIGLLRVAPGWTLFVYLAGVIGVYGVSGSLRRRRLHRRLGPRIVEAFLLERCCPYCGYDLAAVTPDANGRVTCSECSGVWRIPAPSAATALPARRVTLPTVADHRGRRVEVYELWRDVPFDDSPERVPHAVQRRIQQRLTRRRKTIDRAAIVGTVVISLAVFVTLKSTVLAGAPKSSLDLMVLCTLAVVTTCVAAARYWLTRPRRRARIVVRSLLAERLCPSCGQDLNAVPPGTDTLTPCPKCGSTWRLPGTTGGPGH